MTEHCPLPFRYNVVDVWKDGGDSDIKKLPIQLLTIFDLSSSSSLLYARQSKK